MAVLFIRPQVGLPNSSDVITFVWDDFSPQHVEEEATDWVGQLGVILERPGQGSVSITPSAGNPGLVRVKSKADHFAARAAYFLASESAGTVAGQEEGPYESPEALVQQFGASFRLEEALGRVRRLRMRLPKFFEQHLAFLGDRVPGILTNVVLPNGGRTLTGRCTHPQSPLPRWVGKGNEGYSAYATDPEVPENLFACLLVSYSTQEWAFVLWNHQGRRFWFASPIFALYGDADVVRTAEELRETIQGWDKGNGSVFYMSGSGKLPTPQ